MILRWILIFEYVRYFFQIMHFVFIKRTAVHVQSVCLSNVSCKIRVNSSVYVQSFVEKFLKDKLPVLFSEVVFSPSWELLRTLCICHEVEALWHWLLKLASATVHGQHACHHLCHQWLVIGDFLLVWMANANVTDEPDKTWKSLIWKFFMWYSGESECSTWGALLWMLTITGTALLNHIRWHPAVF